MASTPSLHLAQLNLPPCSAGQAGPCAVSRRGREPCPVGSLFAHRSLLNSSSPSQHPSTNRGSRSHRLPTPREPAPLPAACLVLAERTDHPVLVCARVCAEEAEVGEAQRPGTAAQPVFRLWALRGPAGTPGRLRLQISRGHVSSAKGQGPPPRLAATGAPSTGYRRTPVWHSPCATAFISWNPGRHPSGRPIIIPTLQMSKGRHSEVV